MIQLFSQNARYINFTGTYGDFILPSDCFEIVDKIADNVNKFPQHRLKNKLTEKLRFMCETNGGLHDENGGLVQNYKTKI